jgi:type IV pilus assembly protein PilO
MTNRRPLVVGIVSFLIAALVLLMLVMPKRSKVSELTKQIKEAKSLNSQLLIQVDQLGEAKREAPKKAKELAHLDEQIPPMAELPRLLRQLKTKADRAGVEIESIAPNIPTTAGPYSTIPVELTVQGSYFQVEEYLYQLESFTRATKITSATFSPGPALPVLSVAISTQFFTLDTSAGPGSAPESQSVAG